jgi:hypothetical protein
MVTGVYLTTFTGRNIRLDRFSANDVDIEDVAHALSHLCRYNGHCPVFYSVAQHCVRASLAVPKQFALSALLHDAAEAYIGDVTSPLKALLPSYTALERMILGEILIRFGQNPTLPQPVREADRALLYTEVLELGLKVSDEFLSKDPRPIENIHIAHEPPLPPPIAKARFMIAFAGLVGENAD